MAEPKSRELEPHDVGIVLVVAAGVWLGLPSLAVGLALASLVERARRGMACVALGGLLLGVLLYPLAREEAGAWWAATLPDGFAGGPQLDAGWADFLAWSLLALPFAPAFAWAIHVVRPKSLDERQRIEERRATRRQRRSERRARRKVGAELPGKSGAAASIGRKISGEAVLPSERGWLKLPLGRLAHHALVLGASGSGKTETLLRLAWSVARESDWSLFYLDAKGDEATMRRFHALMRAEGRDARLFPREPYAGWRGGAREITNRLIGLIDWATEGGGTYFRDTAVNVVRLACEAPEGPPRSAPELLGRLRPAALAELWAGRPEADDIAAYSARQVDECRQRYQSFFRSVGGRLDGRWAFEDAAAGYLLLNELVYGEETQKLARFLVEDFKQFVASRKQRGARVLLIVDEFSALAEGTPIARVVETVRSYGAAVVLAPQVAEGMGGPEAAARIVGSVGTVFLHRMPQPEEIVGLAGTRTVVESSLQHERGQTTGLGSARYQHAYKVPPNEVRALGPGTAYVMGSGKAARVQIARAPEVPEAPLPVVVEPAAEPPVAPTDEPRPEPLRP